MGETLVSLLPLSDALFLCATSGESYMTLDDVLARLDAAGWWGGIKLSEPEKRRDVKAMLEGMTNEHGGRLFSASGRPRRYVQFVR
jgi:hypothetical protein